MNYFLTSSVVCTSFERAQGNRNYHYQNERNIINKETFYPVGIYNMPIVLKTVKLVYTAQSKTGNLL